MMAHVIGEGPIATALRDADVADGGAAPAQFVVASVPVDPAATIARLRQPAPAYDATVLVVPPSNAAPERAMLLAAIAMLAIEIAPSRRLSAVDVAETALVADVVAAAIFLASATSTTGQVLRVG